MSDLFGNPDRLWCWRNPKGSSKVHALLCRDRLWTLCEATEATEGGRFRGSVDSPTCGHCRNRAERLIAKLDVYPDHRLDDLGDVLVCADWFEERGDPFAAALRYAVEMVDRRCWRCGGSRKLEGRECPECGGSGSVSEHHVRVWRRLSESMPRCVAAAE